MNPICSACFILLLPSLRLVLLDRLALRAATCRSSAREPSRCALLLRVAPYPTLSVPAPLRMPNATDDSYSV